MKTNIYTLLFSFLILISSVGCEDTLDVNKDPLVASEADPNAILPFVIAQYSNRKITELGTRISDVPQHMSFNYNSAAGGSVPIFLTGNTWGMMYDLVLGNLALLEADARKNGAVRNNITAISVTLKALIFYELTSIWGKVPFTEALNGTKFPSPKFDSQEKVLRGLIPMLDEVNVLIAKIPKKGVFNVSKGDLIYGGNMKKWEKFANSLKLRILMMIRNKDNSVDTKIAEVLSSPLIESNADIAILKYAGTPGAQNGYFGIVNKFFGPSNEKQGVHAPSPVFYGLLNNGDPRKTLWIHDPKNNGAPLLGFNARGKYKSHAKFTNNVIRANMPDFLFLPSEVSLYRAELALNGVGSADAKKEYQNGVKKNLDFWGKFIPGRTKSLDDNAIDTYVKSLTDISGLSKEDALKAVHEQQYLECFLNPVLAWNTVRRTKVPALNTPPGSKISTILKRFVYPPDEVGANINTPKNLPTNTPMWFEN